MGSINKSHNEADGGILLFNGELILLYCDSVQCEIGGKESVKGRVYLTTHRLVMIVTPYRQNSAVKSLCAPFCAIIKCNVEQPVFGANYIEATVKDESDNSKSFSFKLKFSKGGAIEFAMAMNRAVSAVGRNFNPSMSQPPAYTPPSAQYYQAPPTVYSPGYTSTNCGFQMPVQQFPDQPPIGFIYASSAPPPYPGLPGVYPQQQPSAGQQGQAQQPPPPYGGYQSASQAPQQPAQHQPSAGQQSGGYPGQGAFPHQSVGYPSAGQQPTGYPSGQQQPGVYPSGQQQPGVYPSGQQQPGVYPSGQQQPGVYPSGQQQPTGYPPAGYPGQQPQQPGAQVSSSGYPDLSQSGSSGPQQQEGSWPSAPSFNPNWQEDKKSA